jgi:hypothetical protein
VVSVQSSDEEVLVSVAVLVVWLWVVSVSVQSSDDEEVVLLLVLLVLVEDGGRLLVDVEHPVAVTTLQLVAQPRPLHLSLHGKDV